MEIVALISIGIIIRSILAINFRTNLPVMTQTFMLAV